MEEVHSKTASASPTAPASKPYAAQPHPSHGRSGTIPPLQLADSVRRRLPVGERRVIHAHLERKAERNACWRCLHQDGTKQPVPE